MVRLVSFWQQYHLGRWALIIVALALFALPLAQIIVPERKLVTNSLLFSFTQMFMLVTMASNWNLTGGYTGYIDFGHAVFFGLGAYGTGVLMAKAGWIFFPSLIVGAIVALIFALLIGSATLRLKGPYFSIAMLGTFVAMREIVRVIKPLTGGGTGLTLPPYLNRPLFYYVTLIQAVIVVVFVWWLIKHTEFGQSLIAIREDEVGAEMRGINATLHKITIFTIAAFSTGLVGGLWAYQNTFIDPDIVFIESRTLDLVMIVMLGGLGTIAGPVLGAVLLYWMRDIIWANFLQFHLIIQGLVLILIVLFLPEGIVGSISDRSGGTTIGRLWGRYFTAEEDTAPEKAEVGP
ncbi:MAG: branched-chain amino acid ABC transporter permease [Anaerolineae bacterium]|nr:MAG: branched-chain amino acid ABC transporter permease [Anaerolineae bacterium]